MSAEEEGHAEGMTAIDIGVPVGAGDEHRHTIQCPEEVEQHGEGRAGGPVQIVEDEEQRLSPTRPPAPRRPHRRGARPGLVQSQPRHLPRRSSGRSQRSPSGTGYQRLGDQQAPQGLDERLVRERGQFVAPPVRNQGPCVVMDLFRERRQEAGLADPRLAGDQRQRPRTRRAPRSDPGCPSCPRARPSARSSRRGRRRAPTPLDFAPRRGSVGCRGAGRRAPHARRCCLDLDAFEHNLATMAARWPGTTLRPHVKAFKSTALAAPAGRRPGTRASAAPRSGRWRAWPRAGLGDDLLLANEVVDVAPARAPGRGRATGSRSRSTPTRRSRPRPRAASARCWST